MNIFHWILVQWTSKLCPFHISKVFLGVQVHFKEKKKLVKKHILVKSTYLCLIFQCEWHHKVKVWWEDGHARVAIQREFMTYEFLIIALDVPTIRAVRGHAAQELIVIGKGKGDLGSQVMLSSVHLKSLDLLQGGKEENHFF